MNHANDLYCRLSHRVAVHSGAAWNIEYPAQITVIVPDASIVPAIGLPQIAGILTIAYEMIGKEQIPATRKRQKDAISVLPGCIVLDCIVAAVICQMQPLVVRGEVVILYEILIAVVREINSPGIVFCHVGTNDVLARAIQIDSGVLVLKDAVAFNQIVVAGLR